jgi:acyl carrier protein
MGTVEERMRKVVAEALEVSLEALHEDASPRTISTWDSGRAITLLLSLEEEFCVSFSDKETIAMTSLSAIRAALLSKGLV